MNIFDLDWQPARIGFGFFATHEFVNGITAHVRCTSIGDVGEGFDLTLLSREGRVMSNLHGLDRRAVNSRLNCVQYLA